MNILLTVDKNMLGPISACIRSISLSKTAAEITVFIIHSPIEKAELDRLIDFCGRLIGKVHFLEIDATHFVHLRQRMREGHVSDAALYRCAMGSLLPDTVEKILYIDCDTLVLKPLDRLYNTDLDGKIAAAHRTPLDHLSDMGVDANEYFNSGVMLIDLALWRKSRVEAETFDVLAAHGPRLKMWDQCALNIVLAGKTAPLDSEYNHLVNRPPVGGHYVVPTILHYAGHRKPWLNGGTIWDGLYLEATQKTPWPLVYSRRKAKKENPFRRLKQSLRKRFSSQI
ncbi:glycosyltransferase family 8 protein [Rhizobium sp. NRK18]|uniref:glycosyltransferase family 8 protein n=1 Tax=Rhizobium sp. NRK18 TaxID=2964667 RepID=UPI0021C393C1|nr:glycosyltransferase family 8 protein [Rhizobium sp. NRK18]MCQ2004426.1 glycosyltransferase family 8 protein [Rhizobium sp. NRK18]